MILVPSPQADAALACMAADEEALLALRSRDARRIRTALAILTDATVLRRELSDARNEIGIVESEGRPTAEILEYRKQAHRIWVRIEELKAERELA